MPPQDLSASHETPGDPVEIRQDAAITIQEALLLCSAEQYPIGKSTMQRWARHWADQGSLSQVKSILVTNRTGSAYRLDRDDFLTWLLEQKSNARPHEIPQDPAMSHKTSPDPTGSRETPQGFTASRETSSRTGEIDERLRDENMQLRIDLEVRKQLLSQAAAEINRQREQTETLLRENGALQLRVRQLGAPQSHAARLGTAVSPDHQDNSGDAPDTSVDNQRDAAGGELY